MPNKKNIPGSTSKTSEQGRTVKSVTLRSPTDLLRKKFEDQNGEWEIVASDGKVFKFHRWILEDQIEHFRALFSHQETKECKDKRIVIPPEENIPGPALEVILRYAYYKDTAGINSSFSIASALVRAGHSYNIPHLVKLAAERIMWYSQTSKRVVWFNVKELKELYEHVCQWKEDHPSRFGLLRSIANVLNKFAKKEERHHKLLEFVNGDLFMRNVLVHVARLTAEGCSDSSNENSDSD